MSSESSSSNPVKEKPQQPHTYFTPLICVHAGAGKYSTNPQRVKLHRSTVSKACIQGMKLLSIPFSTNTTETDNNLLTPASQAVIAAIRHLESSETTNAGIGSNLTIEGTVECDAAIMEGYGDDDGSTVNDRDRKQSGGFGAVGAVSGLRHPIDGAAAVMNGRKRGLGKVGRVPPMMVVGEGGRKWCEREGVEVVSKEEMITSDARKRWERMINMLLSNGQVIKNEGFVDIGGEEVDYETDSCEINNGKRNRIEDELGAQIQKRPRLNSSDSPHDKTCDYEIDEESSASEFDDESFEDTVGAVALDAFGNIAAGVSSGGIHLKVPGRIGEAAMYGCGLWAQTPPKPKPSPNLETTTNLPPNSSHSFQPPPGLGCSLSGTGEQIMQTMLAREISQTVSRTANNHNDDANQVYNALKSVMVDFASSKMLKVDGYEQRNAGVVMIHVSNMGDENTNDDLSDGISDKDNSETIEDQVNQGEKDTALFANREVWVAHTTDAMCVGWMSMGDLKPKTMISRKRAGDVVHIFGEFVPI
ncbi:taspase, threonine aspartase, 1, partial [Blyttiomyces sp. JEL0837]